MPQSAFPTHNVDVLTQLISGPSLTEVASSFLHPALKALYPHLDIDPGRTLVGTPTWRTVGDHVESADVWFESLTDALIRLGLSGATQAWIDGEHFLTSQPALDPATQLPVKIEAIACLLNELSPLLFTAFQEQQLNHWNHPTGSGQPRWRELSDTLRRVWNVSGDCGWNADEQAMAHAVFNSPDRARRKPGDRFATRACLIDLDYADADGRRHLGLLDTAVLVGTLGQRTLILMHSLTRGFERFDSLAALGRALKWSFIPPALPSGLRWRLVEPSGDFFDRQACTLIALEVETIGSMGAASPPPLRAHTDEPSQPALSRRPALLGQLLHALPPWLESASPADKSRYGRHLLDLAAAQQRNGATSFQREVPSLRDFTLRALNEAVTPPPGTDHNLNLQAVEITIDSVVVWGTFIPPGQRQTQTLSLVELALQNLAGLPTGNFSVRYRDGSAVPGWLTPDFLTGLVTRVNIGETYPAHLKRLLIDDTAQATRLEQLYALQLPLELSLLALQHKIEGKAGIDDRGYRYTVAALAADPSQRTVDGLEIVIRPLAFVTADHADGAADEVANMYVIGPREPADKPCLLYRPLLDPPLIQYPSATNLLYAIKHSPPLRQSVLAWLADEVRFNYSQYVFPGAVPSVWSVPQLLVDPGVSPQLTGPVALGGEVIGQDILKTLFKANAQALISQADRQTVSNAEARWASLKRGGWNLFNAALPFLGRGVGAAAWIWQILDDLQEVADAQEQASAQTAGFALTDLFLNLAMLLAHRAAIRETPPLRQVAETKNPPAPKPPKPLGPPTGQPLPSTIDILPDRHEGLLHTVGALHHSDSGLGVVLDSLKVDRPARLAVAATEGDHRYLHPDGRRWYACVGERWFEVELNDDDDVQIIDSRQQPVRRGPLLIADAKGQWFIDTRLRLRGGGLGSRRKQLRQQNRQRLQAMKEAISAFDGVMEDKRTQLVNARRAMLEADEQTADAARQAFLATLDAQIEDYSAHIENIKRLNALEAVPNYRTAMLDRIALQLFLMQSWFGERFPEFREHLRIALDLQEQALPAATPAHMAAFEKLAGLTQGMLDKIDFANSRFAELELLGREAAEVARENRALLPPFEPQDLKLLQITLAQELCISAEPTAPEESPLREEARQALHRLVEEAELNVQSTLDLGADESLDRLGERIEALSSLVEQFEIIEQRFADLSADYPQYVIQERLEQTQHHVAGFRQDAVEQLSALLREQRLVEPVAGPSKPVIPRTRKIIRTRYKGTLVGQQRADDQRLVDVVAPITGKVIATFHEKTPGVWLERVAAQGPAAPKPAPDLARSLQEGQALLDGLPAFIRRTQAFVGRATRNPTEIEEIHEQHAKRLRDAVEKIDSALTAGNLTESRTGSAATLRQQLDAQADALYAKGRAVRIEMTKRQAPTAARVQWLKELDEVSIVSTGGRRRLKGPRKDFLQEYEVLDAKTGQALWYAHFHYAALADPPFSFTAAHLKTLDQRRLGGAYESREGRSDHELIAIHRSAIGQAHAALFLSRTGA